jgi:hypothetical protein
MSMLANSSFPILVMSLDRELAVKISRPQDLAGKYSREMSTLACLSHYSPQ